MRRIALAALLAIAASPAIAEMPYYNVEAECQKIAAFGGAPSQTMLQACLQQEQAAYNALKPRWAGLPSDIRKHCDEIARFGGDGNYTMLQACIQQETAAAGANSGFKFQR
jgi:hypothetical protein